MTINRIPADNFFFVLSLRTFLQQALSGCAEALEMGGYKYLMSVSWVRFISVESMIIFFNLHLLSILLDDQSHINIYFSSEMVKP